MNYLSLTKLSAVRKWGQRDPNQSFLRVMDRFHAHFRQVVRWGGTDFFKLLGFRIMVSLM